MVNNEVSLSLPRDIYDALIKASKLSGKPIEELIIDAIKDELDPRDRVELYVKLHENYLRNAEELESRGNLVQAGEKLWGAVTALLNAIAEDRGWSHYSHVDYNVVIQNPYNEVKDKELITGFRMAEGLHANFYHNFMNRETFELHRDAVLNLVRKLREFLRINA